jgi:hypothetical protein
VFYDHCYRLAFDEHPWDRHTYSSARDDRFDEAFRRCVIRHRDQEDQRRVIAGLLDEGIYRIGFQSYAYRGHAGLIDPPCQYGCGF